MQVRRTNRPLFDSSKINGYLLCLFPPGEHLGPYEILVSIGTGGIGEVWYNRAGKAIDEIESTGTELIPALSPDGRRLVVTRKDSLGQRGIWVYDLVQKRWMQLTFEPGAGVPVWSADGSSLTP